MEICAEAEEGMRRVFAPAAISFGVLAHIDIGSGEVRSGFGLGFKGSGRVHTRFCRGYHLGQISFGSLHGSTALFGLCNKFCI